MKYPSPDGWVTPVRKGYKFMCCDCGLVHSIDFRIKGGLIQFRVDRDNRATAAARRKKRPIESVRKVGGYSRYE